MLEFRSSNILTSTGFTLVSLLPIIGAPIFDTFVTTALGATHRSLDGSIQISSLYSITEFSRTAIKVISKNQEVDISENFDISLTKLLNLLRRSKCLIVLDNYQSVFELGGEPGKHAKDFIDYGKFLQKVVEERHLSTVLIASREKPEILNRLLNSEGISNSVTLQGISSGAARLLIDDQDALNILNKCEEKDWDEFVDRLQGNPLLILLTSVYVRDYYEGSVSEYLEEEGIQRQGL